MRGLKIGELASRTGCQVETIRYYEREGLLPEPARTDSNYRLYNDTHVDHLTFIRHCRSLDMALDEIRTLLKFRDAPEQNWGDVNALLDEHIGHVAGRIAQLKTLEAQLKKLRSLCNMVQTTKECGILNELATESSVSSKKENAGRHVDGSHARGKSS